VAGRVIERGEQDQARPGVDDFADGGRDIGWRPGGRRGLDRGHPAAVDRCQARVDPLAGPAGVVVDRDVDPLGDRERRLVPASPGQR
jgi:hypothetical protein